MSNEVPKEKTTDKLPDSVMEKFQQVVKNVLRAEQSKVLLFDLARSEDTKELKKALDVFADKEVAAKLKEQGIDVNVTDGNGSTMLISAADYNRAKNVAALLEVDGIDVNVANKDGMTALMLVAKNDSEADIDNLATLLKVDGINVNVVNKYGMTALIGAATMGPARNVAALLEVDGIEGVDSALRWAKERDRPEIVDMIEAFQKKNRELGPYLDAGGAGSGRAPKPAGP